MRGFLIAFEGIEGSGKTSQAQLLFSWLEKRAYQTVLRKEPTEGPVGKLIHEILGKQVDVPDESIPLLFAADRADNTRRFIRPELQKGAVVICDRSVYSSLAYQSTGMLAPFDLRWLRAINKYAITPDVVFYLDIEPEIGLNRVSGGQRLQDDTYFADITTQKRIREAYEEILGFNKPSLIVKLEANGIAKAVLNSVQLSKVDGALAVRLDGADPESRVHEQIIAFVQWSISRQTQEVKRRRVAPRGVVPLGQFTKTFEDTNLQQE